MAEELVVGSNTTPAGGGFANTIYFARFQATQTANGVTKFYIYKYSADASRNAKVAVYSDNAGAVGTRLAYNDSAQALATAAGWNQLSISSINISSGTYYWLGAIVDANNAIGRDASGGTAKYASATFSTWAWPEPHGLTFSDQTNLYALYLLGETGAGGGKALLIRGLTDSILTGGLL